MARILIGVLVLAWLAGPALAADDGPAPTPMAPAARPAVTAESRDNAGRSLGQQGDWTGAEKAYRDATRLNRRYPEAWNGLGYALRLQGQYEESVRAYQEALRLRPDYPAALEYLGEAYVQMGRLDDARALLDRLRSLDPREAETLEQAIARASRR